MVNEEEYLVKKMGRGKPFSVPDGYFDQLAERIMQQLPQEEKQLSQEANKLQAIKKPATIKRLRPWLYAAACVGVVALSATILFKSAPSPTASEQRTLVSQAETTQETYYDYSDSYIEDAANYAMIDNDDIYAYLADL
jgi:hypothetical protein